MPTSTKSKENIMSSPSKKPKYVSKGERPCVSNSNKVKPTATATALNKMRAYISGKKSYVTIDNPDINATNKKKIRIPYNQLMGVLADYKHAATYIVHGNKV